MNLEELEKLFSEVSAVNLSHTSSHSDDRDSNEDIICI